MGEFEILAPEAWVDLLDEKPYAHIIRGIEGEVLTKTGSEARDKSGQANLSIKGNEFSLVGRQLEPPNVIHTGRNEHYLLVLLESQDSNKAQDIADCIVLLHMVYTTGDLLVSKSIVETAPVIKEIDYSYVKSGAITESYFEEMILSGFSHLTMIHQHDLMWCLSKVELLLNDTRIMSALMYFMFTLDYFFLDCSKAGDVDDAYKKEAHSVIVKAMIENLLINYAKSIEAIMGDWTGDSIDKKEDEFVYKTRDLSGVNPRDRNIHDRSWLDICKELMKVRDKCAAHSAVPNKPHVSFKDLCNFKHFVQDFLLEVLNNTPTSPR